LKYAGFTKHMALMALASTFVHLSLLHLLPWLSSLRLLQHRWFNASGSPFRHRGITPAPSYFMLSPHRFCGELLPLFSSAAPLP
jgi:polyferredoxin